MPHQPSPSKQVPGFIQTVVWGWVEGPKTLTGGILPDKQEVWNQVNADLSPWGMSIKWDQGWELVSHIPDTPWVLYAGTFKDCCLVAIEYIKIRIGSDA